MEGAWKNCFVGIKQHFTEGSTGLRGWGSEGLYKENTVMNLFTLGHQVDGFKKSLGMNEKWNDGNIRPSPLPIQSGVFIVVILLFNNKWL